MADRRRFLIALKGTRPLFAPFLDVPGKHGRVECASDAVPFPRVIDRTVSSAKVPGSKSVLVIKPPRGGAMEYRGGIEERCISLFAKCAHLPHLDRIAFRAGLPDTLHGAVVCLGPRYFSLSSVFAHALAQTPCCISPVRGNWYATEEGRLSRSANGEYLSMPIACEPLEQNFWTTDGWRVAHKHRGWSRITVSQFGDRSCFGRISLELRVASPRDRILNSCSHFVSRDSTSSIARPGYRPRAEEENGPSNDIARRIICSADGIK